MIMQLLEYETVTDRGATDADSTGSRAPARQGKPGTPGLALASSSGRRDRPGCGGRHRASIYPAKRLERWRRNLQQPGARSCRGEGNLPAGAASWRAAQPGMDELRNLRPADPQ